MLNKLKSLTKTSSHLKPNSEMTIEELIHECEWANRIGFHFIAKEAYKELVKRGYIKEEKSILTGSRP